MRLWCCLVLFVSSVLFASERVWEPDALLGEPFGTYGIDAGEIAEGKLADCLLVDIANERMVPSHDLVSNWVYAADSSCIDSVICNGKFVMRGRRVDGEDDIKKEAEACAKSLYRKEQRQAASARNPHGTGQNYSRVYAHCHGANL